MQTLIFRAVFRVVGGFGDGFEQRPLFRFSSLRHDRVLGIFSYSTTSNILSESLSE